MTDSIYFSSSWVDPGLHCIFFQLNSDQLADVYKGFVKDFPVVSIEDPFDQDDWDAYSKYTAATDIQIVG